MVLSGLAVIVLGGTGSLKAALPLQVGRNGNRSLMAVAGLVKGGQDGNEAVPLGAGLGVNQGMHGLAGFCFAQFDGLTEPELLIQKLTAYTTFDNKACKSRDVVFVAICSSHRQIHFTLTASLAAIYFKVTFSGNVIHDLGVLMVSLRHHLNPS